MTHQHTHGIHHITAISSAADENLAFYERVLGLRLVKQTVNFDDPYTYHLYYGDATGTPGTLVTFFPWERMPAGRPGAGMIVATAFAVHREALPYWAERLTTAGIQVHEGIRFNEPLLKFQDPHGLALELIGCGNLPALSCRQTGPVDHAHAIRGFHSATALLNHLENTQALLTGSMGMDAPIREQNRFRFTMNGLQSAAGRTLDVVVDPHAPKGRLGTGSVHHIAFRVRTDAEQLHWQANLRKSGVNVTEVRDRNYFKSIYFHEPGGILFEMATDSPGFAVDEPIENLGNSLMLPAGYERLRPRIEAALPALHRKERAEWGWVDEGRAIDSSCLSPQI